MRTLYRFLDRLFGSRVYLDYAAATPLRHFIRREMERVLKLYGNPSSIHGEGVAARRGLTEIRTRAARALRARAEEIIFTSGGTESNNLAIQGVINAALETRKNEKSIHIITSVVEHTSVLEPIQRAQERGALVTYVKPDNRGMIDPRHVQEALTPETILVSLMYVNNEIGTITDLRKISRAVRAFRNNQQSAFPKERHYPLLHTDASQAPLFLDCAPERLGVDLLTVDAAKLYGPKGSGILFRRRGVPLARVSGGGTQEWGARPGTESLMLAVGATAALERAQKTHQESAHAVARLRDYVFQKLEKEFPQVTLNGDTKKRVANNVNISIPNIDPEFFVIQLDQLGIAASTASACKFGEISSVVGELGRGNQDSGAIRITLGLETKQEDIDRLIRALQYLLKN